MEPLPCTSSGPQRLAVVIPCPEGHGPMEQTRWGDAKPHYDVDDRFKCRHCPREARLVMQAPMVSMR